MTLPFKNDDDILRREVANVLAERRALGLNGLVGGLEAVIINTEHDRQRQAVQELLDTTGYAFAAAFEEHTNITCTLQQEGSPDILVTSRKELENPFRAFNEHPKSGHLPNTRLETFVFKCPQIEKFVDIQKSRGVRFLTSEIVETDKYLFIQTEPSAYTGNSIGYIKWLEDEGDYAWEGCAPLHWIFHKPDKPYLKHVFELDHTATRVRAEERDLAILEFLRLTNYGFDFAIYVETLNSITSVARLSKDDYAQVFTSGIEPFKGVGQSGPTEMYIHNYGTRVHHMAFRTEHINETFRALKADGMEFLVELVGSPDEGLQQTFTKGLPSTFIVNEYIQRYGDFDGFFTRSNVTLLTKATEKQ